MGNVFLAATYKCILMSVPQDTLLLTSRSPSKRDLGGQGPSRKPPHSSTPYSPPHKGQKLKM